MPGACRPRGRRRRRRRDAARRQSTPSIGRPRQREACSSGGTGRGGRLARSRAGRPLRRDRRCPRAAARRRGRRASCPARSTTGRRARARHPGPLAEPAGPDRPDARDRGRPDRRRHPPPGASLRRCSSTRAGASAARRLRSARAAEARLRRRPLELVIRAVTLIERPRKPSSVDVVPAAGTRGRTAAAARRPGSLRPARSRVVCAGTSRRCAAEQSRRPRARRRLVRGQDPPQQPEVLPSGGASRG